MKFFTLFLLTLFNLEALAAEALPLWEAGLGTLTFRAPHYRGSKQDKKYLWPLPYVTIRDKKVQAENSFLRGNFYMSESFTIDLSINAGLNANSAENTKRQGMPDIHNTFEVGPMVRYKIWSDAEKSNILTIEMPFRAVFATDFKQVEHVGYFSIPYLNFLSKPQAWNKFWSMELSIGPMWANHGFHDYYYAISENYVNSGRPYYKARSGYSGTQAAIVVTKRHKNWLFFPFIRYDFLHQAVFRDSPLVETRHYAFFGMGLVYFFASSSQKQTSIYQVK